MQKCCLEVDREIQVLVKKIPSPNCCSTLMVLVALLSMTAEKILFEFWFLVHTILWPVGIFSNKSFSLLSQFLCFKKGRFSECYFLGGEKMFSIAMFIQQLSLSLIGCCVVQLTPDS